jgi:hypothetical protein
MMTGRLHRTTRGAGRPTSAQPEPQLTARKARAGSVPAWNPTLAVIAAHYGKHI